MLHKVVMPFRFSWDGITAVDLNVGDVRDFGQAAKGLTGMGWIKPVAAETAAVVEVDEPIEMAIDRPRRGRPRK